MKQISQIRNWLELLVNKQKLSLESSWEIEILQGDASCRRYYRLESSLCNYIIVASPIDRIDNNVFITLAQKWFAQGVNVPEIYHIEKQLGFMLLEDFGSVHLFDLLQQSLDHALYDKALHQLQKIQNLDPIDLPLFDEPFLLREMTLFDTWMVKYQLNIDTPAFLPKVFDVLINNSLQQPQITMHRDYHSRNLLLQNHQIKVIDFQDAVKGPLAYDLVSILKDCYISLPDEMQAKLIDLYLSRLNESNLLAVNVGRQQFEKWFDLLGLQRHLKVLGLFIKLGVEEGKTDYLKDLPRVFDYVLRAASKYSEFSLFALWLSDVVEPALIEQPWFNRPE